MIRSANASVRVATVAALLAASAALEAAAKPSSVPSALTTHETLRQSLAFRSRGPAAGLLVREKRRFTARLNVLLPGLNPGGIDGNSYLGLRIGDWTFERPVSFDRAWKPGKTTASFRVRSTDARRPGATVVRAAWGGGVLRVSVTSTDEAPIAEAVVAAPTGPVSTAVDAAARLDAQHVHLRGTATGAMKRTVVPVLESSADLARLDLRTTASVVEDTDDSSAPVVTITKPAAVSTQASGTLTVEGTARDDRSIASIKWAVDGGPQTNVPFAVDPSSGFLDDVRAPFSFSAPATSGMHALRVYARDVAGNVGVASVNFTVAVPVADAIVLRAVKWGTTRVDVQGRVQAWGWGTKTPTVAAGVAAARAAAGNVALLDDGTVTTLQGGPIQGLSGVADVAQCSAISGSFALRADGTVWAWGDNSYGQLGDGTTTSHSVPAPVPGLASIQAISAGAFHALALDQNGDVWTWGGWVAQTDAAARSPRKVAGIAGAVVISASQFDRYNADAAVLSDGSLWMWGDETSGQLGSSITVRERPAFMVQGVAGAKSVAMGYNHALVLLNDGTVLARGGPTSQVWGYWGELGNGTTTPNLEFQPVPGLFGVAGVSAGAHTSFATMLDGTIRAWGENTYGSVGDGASTDALSPVVVQLSQ